MTTRQIGCIVLLALFQTAGSGPAMAFPATDHGLAPGDTLKNREGWRPLFDGVSLDGWKITDFGGQGQVYVEDSTLVMEMGDALTGITWTGDFPRSNYEVSLEAMRVEGHDFFCGLTFPVKDDPLSLIIGGWGGGVVGLSSVDGFDASENNYSTFRQFASDRWYNIRLRVTDDTVAAWIDDDQIIDLPLEGHELSIRVEVGLSRPFGVASWRTTAALRNFYLRELDEAER